MLLCRVAYQWILCGYREYISGFDRGDFWFSWYRFDFELSFISCRLSCFYLLAEVNIKISYWCEKEGQEYFGGF